MWQKYVIRMVYICIRKLLTWNWTVRLSVQCKCDDVFSVGGLALFACLVLSLGSFPKWCIL